MEHLHTPSENSPLYSEIVGYINDLEIAPYLQEETKKILQYLSHYKLENIHRNLSFF